MAAIPYTIDVTHSSITFSVRHMVMAKVRGHFTKWEGAFTYDAQNPAASSIDVKIDAASIDTREAQRDTHLKSPDFLDVAKHPSITFKSKRVEKSGGGLRIIGDLSIHGVTRESVLDVDTLGEAKDPWGNLRAAFSAKTTVNRHDFGLKWNQALEAGGVLVGENIEILIDVEANRKA